MMTLRNHRVWPKMVTHPPSKLSEVPGGVLHNVVESAQAVDGSTGVTRGAHLAFLGQGATAIRQRSGLHV
jgi:hypothetical protein